MASDLRLPEGTVTFFFSDIEGSTRLAATLGDSWRVVLEQHAVLIREAIGSAGGIEVSTDGDSFFCVFTDAKAAVAASTDIHRALASYTWPGDKDLKVRIGLHTGAGSRGGDNYTGVDLHLAARVGAAGHGGQLVVTEATYALVATDLTIDVEWRDLGEHVLKDIPQPVRLYQAVADGFSDTFRPLRTLTAPVHLPAQLTSFLGREDLVGDILHRLDEGRIVTLTGPGGTGKTRAAIAAAADAAVRFTDGVYFVDLAPISEESLVAPTILAALMVPQMTGSPMERLKDYLAGREILLLLDNFEQLVEAGNVLVELVATAPGLRLLITSRAPLRVQGEQEIPVDPLETPSRGTLADMDAVSKTASVALFVDRARAVRPNFELDRSNYEAVRDIVTSLDGLPLAIELAATRTRVLTPDDIAARFGDRLAILTGGTRDLPARQRTIRAVIDWSYGLLPEQSQTLFPILGAFVGGFDLDQVESIAHDAFDGEVLDEVGELVERSLVQRHETNGQARFRLLEVVRDFAFEKLQSSGNQDLVRENHARVYLELAESASPHLLGPDQRRWLDRLERDHDNLRTALVWAIEQNESEVADRLLWALWRMWQMRGHLDEGLLRAESVIAIPSADAPSRIRALEATGGLAYWRGDLEKAVDSYQEAVVLARRNGDQALVADALYNLAFGLTMGEGDRQAGRVAMEEAEAIYRRKGDRPGEANALFGRASVAWEGRTFADYEEALPLYRQAAEIYGELDDWYQLAWSRRLGARCLLELNQPDEARPHLLEAADLFIEAQDVSAVTILVTDFMMEAMLVGDTERAIRLLGAARKMRDTTGAGLVDYRSFQVEGLEEAEKRMGDRAENLLSDGAVMPYDDLIRYLVEDPHPS